MKKVSLDTVGLIALWDESDQWNAVATKAYELMRLRKTRIVTTSWILVECGNAASRRPYRHEVSKLRRLLERAGNLIIPSDSQVDAAWEDYARRGPGAAGIVDLVSFIVMRELGITDAFSNDVHFRTEGFITLF